jgi:hypothetical protein
MLSKLQNIRRQVAELRATLLTPSFEGVSFDQLDSLLPGLQEAAAALQLLQLNPEAGSRQELEALARDLRSAARLIEHGRELVAGWARLLASSAACYRPNGEPISPAPPVHISVRG